MKRKLIRRNKQFLTSTMGKYVGDRSWRKVIWFLVEENKMSWKYRWLINNKAIEAHLKDLEDNYEEISLDDY